MKTKKHIPPDSQVPETWRSGDAWLINLLRETDTVKVPEDAEFWGRQREGIMAKLALLEKTETTRKSESKTKANPTMQSPAWVSSQWLDDDSV